MEIEAAFKHWSRICFFRPLPRVTQQDDVAEDAEFRVDPPQDVDEEDVVAATQRVLGLEDEVESVRQLEKRYRTGGEHSDEQLLQQNKVRPTFTEV